MGREALNFAEQRPGSGRKAERLLDQLEDSPAMMNNLRYFDKNADSRISSARDQIALWGGRSALETDNTSDDSAAIRKIEERLEKNENGPLNDELLKVLKELKTSIDKQTQSKTISTRESTLGIPGVETPISSPKSRQSMAGTIQLGGSTLNCWSLRPASAGNVWPVPVVAAEEWNVPGVDDKGIGLGSMNDPECEVECTQYGTASEIANWQGQFDYLLGATCKMVSNLGQRRDWVVVKYKYTRRPGRLSSFIGYE